MKYIYSQEYKYRTFTRSEICFKPISGVARARKRAYTVRTSLLTATIVRWTLVGIWNNRTIRHWYL